LSTSLAELGAGSVEHGEPDADGQHLPGAPGVRDCQALEMRSRMRSAASAPVVNVCSGKTHKNSSPP
jgi:hypothetical protein